MVCFATSLRNSSATSPQIAWCVFQKGTQPIHFESMFLRPGGLDRTPAAEHPVGRCREEWLASAKLEDARMGMAALARGWDGGGPPKQRLSDALMRKHPLIQNRSPSCPKRGPPTERFMKIHALESRGLQGIPRPHPISQCQASCPSAAQGWHLPGSESPAHCLLSFTSLYRWDG